MSYKLTFNHASGAPETPPISFEDAVVDAEGAVFVPQRQGDVFSWTQYATLGGAIPDPLEIGAVEATDYLAVGTVPAQSGAIRLSKTSSIAARNNAADADQILLRPSTFINGLDIFDVLLLGESLLWDPDYSTTWYLFNDLSFMVSDLAFGDYDGDNAKSGGYAEVTPSKIVLGSVGVARATLDRSGTDPRFYPWADNAGSLGLATRTWGDIFATLPTADPVVAGQFWNDAGTVKVSAG